MESRVGEAVVAPVRRVVEEVLHHGHGNEEAHVVEARIALEGDAHHPSVLDHRPAAVAGIDGGVRLHHEVGIDAGVHVAARLDSGHDAGGGGDLLAPEGEAVGGDPRPERGSSPKSRGFMPRAKAGSSTLRTARSQS